MEHEPLILDSAHKWGVKDADMRHAVSHHSRWFVQDDGMTMFIGPSTTGALLEVGVIDWYGTDAIAHAMPARDKYLR